MATSDRTRPAALRTRFARDPRERARRVLPGGYGRSTFMVGAGAPYALRGEGCRLFDDTGRALIDLNNNFTALIHGHAHPRIVAAGVKALQDGASYGLPNAAELDHAEALLERLPHADLVRYTNSGTEAAMTALRVARAHTGRSRAILVRSAYHGTSDPVLAAGGDRSQRGVPPSLLAETLLVPLNDEFALAETLRRHHGEIAAVLIDLMANRSGLVSAEPSYVRLLANLCREHGIVLIADEVISFRLRWDGLASAYDLQPDLSVLGKLIGGGLPVGAVAGRRELMEELDPASARGLEHGGTFSGNPATLASGLAAMRLFDREAVTRLNALGNRARAALAERLEPLGWTVRGRGSLLRPIPSGDAAAQAEQTRALWWGCYERNVLLNPSGLVALSTPLTGELVDYAVAAIAAAAEDVAEDWRPPVEAPPGEPAAAAPLPEA